MKVDLANKTIVGPGSTPRFNLDNHVVLPHPFRYRDREEETGFALVFAAREMSILPLKVYAKLSEFTDAEIKKLINTPIGFPMRAHAESVFDERGYVVTLSRPQLANEWCAIWKDVVATTEDVSRLPEMPEPNTSTFSVYQGHGTVLFKYESAGNNAYYLCDGIRTQRHALN